MNVLDCVYQKVEDKINLSVAWQCAKVLLLQVFLSDRTDNSKGESQTVFQLNWPETSDTIYSPAPAACVFEAGGSL